MLLLLLLRLLLLLLLLLLRLRLLLLRLRLLLLLPPLAAFLSYYPTRSRDSSPSGVATILRKIPTEGHRDGRHARPRRPKA